MGQIWLTETMKKLSPEEGLLTTSGVPVPLWYVDFDVINWENHSESLSWDEAKMGAVTSQGGVGVLDLYFYFWFILLLPVLKVSCSINLNKR